MADIRLRKGKEPLSSTVNDALVVVATGFFSGFGGAWAFSQSDISVTKKTWLAILIGVAGGIALSRWNKPVGLGFAAGLGGLGVTAMIAQAAGAAESGELFGFKQASETRRLRRPRKLEEPSPTLRGQTVHSLQQGRYTSV